MIIVGRGRLGCAFSAGLRAAGLIVEGPLGRDAKPIARAVQAARAVDPGSSGHDPDLAAPAAVLLCVPDAEIAAAAAGLARGLIVGHCSGATGLDAIGVHEAFSLHPLMSVTSAGVDFSGAAAAIAGSTARALDLAAQLAHALGMTPVSLAEQDRAAYHAAASIASNFLITLEAAAERLAASAGVGHELLVPLVRATVENWAALGAPGALTGPIVRGDELTVQRQREAVSERAPDLLPLFDALVQATRALAQREPAPGRPARAPSERPAPNRAKVA